MAHHRRRCSVPIANSAFAGFRFPPEVITVAVRWYLRFGLSYRDVEELLAERGVNVDHVTVYRWVRRFTPIFAEAARPRRHAVGDRWRHCCVAPRRSPTSHTSGVPDHRRRSCVPIADSAFAGFRFPAEVITVAVRWYLRFGLSYRDVEELLAERGVDVDHVSIYRWVQRFTPIFAEAARPRRHAVGDRWQVDETYVKVAGTWRYLYRAIDQFGQVVDVFLSAQRDARAARQFFADAVRRTQTEPVEVVTDRARAYSGVLDELLPRAFHDVGQYANNRVEADHGRLKARLRPMRGLKTTAGTRRVCLGHAFIQNLRRGHYEIAVDLPSKYRVAEAFAELALVIQSTCPPSGGSRHPRYRTTQQSPPDPPFPTKRLLELSGPQQRVVRGSRRCVCPPTRIECVRGYRPARDRRKRWEVSPRNRPWRFSMSQSRSSRARTRRVVASLIAAVATMLAVLVGTESAHAAVSVVRGGAYGSFSSVSLFGGPFGWRGPEGFSGCGVTSTVTCSAAVNLPPNGALRSKSDPGGDGAVATYGPANIFSSGQQQVSTQGTLGVGGSVTSSATLQNINKTGDEVFTANSVSSSCTASEAGVSATTTINTGKVQTSEGNPDVEGDEVYVTVPTNPTPGTTIHGVLESVGDRFDYKFNEQTVNPDGSITVTAAHLYLLGPSAVGHVYVGQATCGVTDRRAPIDFDEDGDTDVSLFRPGNSYWFVNGGPAAQFGTSGDIPVPGDYDNDGDTDRAVYRPSNGYWFIDGGDIVQWGASGDIPVPADYDGDGDADIAVFRPSSGYWFVAGGPTVQFGAQGDIPVPADYTGDGVVDIAVFRPSSGMWFVNGGPMAQFGSNGDIPVPGDYTGDGLADFTVFRPSSGYWFVNGGATVRFGTNGDIPELGNYDGDADTDIAIFRPSNGYWFVNGGTTTQFGGSGDVPLPLPDAIRRFFFPAL